MLAATIKDISLSETESNKDLMSGAVSFTLLPTGTEYQHEDYRNYISLSSPPSPPISDEDTREVEERNVYYHVFRNEDFEQHVHCMSALEYPSAFAYPWARHDESNWGERQFIESGNLYPQAGSSACASWLNHFDDLWGGTFTVRDSRVETESGSQAYCSHMQLRAWYGQIGKSQDYSEIVAVLRLFGFEEVADRLSYLWQLVMEDLEDPSEVISVESLRSLATFLIDERHMGIPQISISPDGSALATWRVIQRGIIAMKFLPSGLVRLVATSGRVEAQTETLRVSGTLSRAKIMEAIRSFVSSR